MSKGKKIKDTERINISVLPDSTSIIIYPYYDKIKQLLLGAWLLVWTIAGIIILYQVIISDNNEQQLFFGIWLVFWAYFEYLAGYSFLWRKFGLERILIKNNTLYYKRDIKDSGKSQIFNVDFIKDISIIEISETSFFKIVNDAYWQVAGETVSFLYNGKTIRIGLQLNKNESAKLVRLLKGKIRI